MEESGILILPVSRIKSDRIDSFLFELRRSLSWAWLLPLLVVLASCFFARISYVSPKQQAQQVIHGGQGSDNTNEPKQPVVSIKKRMAETPNYAESLRNNFERFLPLTSTILFLTLLAKEWHQGILAQLAMRRRLTYLLAGRMAIILSYLILFVFLTGVLSMLFTEEPPLDGNVLLWAWELCLTVFPSIFLKSPSVCSSPILL